jgi:hypothetical protein
MIKFLFLALMSVMAMGQQTTIKRILWEGILGPLGSDTSSSFVSKVGAPIGAGRIVGWMPGLGGASPEYKLQ